MEEKDKPSHFFYMYKRLFLCIITNKVFIIIFSTVEFMDIFVGTLVLVPDFFEYNKSYEIKDIKVSNFLYKISPYSHFHNFLIDQSNFSIHKTPAYFTIIVYSIFWIIFYITLYSIGDFDYDRESTFHKVKSIILINFYSYCFMRLIGIYGIHSIISLIISIILQKNYTSHRIAC